MIKITLDSKRRTVLIVDRVDMDGDEYVCRIGQVIRRIPSDKVLYMDSVFEHTQSQPSSLPPEYRQPAPPTPPPQPVLNREFAAAVERNMSGVGGYGPSAEPEVAESSSALIDVLITGSVNERFSVLCTAGDAAARIMTESLTRAVFDDHQVMDAIYGHNVVHIRKESGAVMIETRESLPSPPVSMQEAVAKIADVSHTISRKFGASGLTPDEDA